MKGNKIMNENVTPSKIEMKPFELFVKFQNNGMVFKFKKNTIDECRAVVDDFKAKYPEATVSYMIIEKKVVESEGEI